MSDEGLFEAFVWSTQHQQPTLCKISCPNWQVHSSNSQSQRLAYVSSQETVSSKCNKVKYKNETQMQNTFYSGLLTLLIERAAEEVFVLGLKDNLFKKKSTTATAVNHLYPRYNTTYVTRPISKVTERWFSIYRDLFVRARWTRAPQLVCLNNRE